MATETLSPKHFRVSYRAHGHVWRFNLKGGFFATPSKAEQAAEFLARDSMRLLIAAETVRLALKGLETLPERWQAGDCLMKWQNVGAMLDEFALVVPETGKGFKTGSGGLPFFYYDQVQSLSHAVQSALTNRAPRTAEKGDMAHFHERWTMATLERSPPNYSKLCELYQRYNRPNNVRALIGRETDGQQKISNHALSEATNHIFDLIPEIKPEPKVIRGNHAQSLMNIMVPQLREKFSQIQDPVERAKLESRLDKVADRVAIASAGVNAERVLKDALLSMEVLEESVEHRLPAVSGSETPSL